MKNITIIGTGYVGLVSGSGFAEFGHNVICADIDEEKISKLNSGEIPIYEPGLERLINRNINKGTLSFSSDTELAIRSSEVIFIAVGTPQGIDGKADLSAIESVANTISKNINTYKLICTKSTVPIGAGKWITSIIKSKNKRKSFDYISNPEFLREGSSVNDFMHPDRIIIGSNGDNEIKKIVKDIYRPININRIPILFSTIETAEMIKYSSNAFLSLKISYINEIANLCDKLGADIHQVTDAMGRDGRISPKFLHPGPGFGGSCFPKDTKALASIGRDHKSPLLTIEAALKTNSRQRTLMVKKIKKLLGGKLNGFTISVLGLSFKPQTDDIRGSVASYIVKILQDEGAKINAYDPVAIDNFRLIYPSINYFTSWQSAVDNTDACVLFTEWNEFRAIDLSKLKKLMKTPIILDTKNILNISELKKLSFRFDNVGRSNIQ